MCLSQISYALILGRFPSLASTAILICDQTQGGLGNTCIYSHQVICGMEEIPFPLTASFLPWLCNGQPGNTPWRIKTERISKSSSCFSLAICKVSSTPSFWSKWSCSHHVPFFNFLPSRFPISDARETLLYQIWESLLILFLVIFSVFWSPQRFSMSCRDRPVSQF